MALGDGSQSKSSGPEPYTGPDAEVTDNGSATDYLPLGRTKLSPIPHNHPRRHEWDSCREIAQSIVRDAGVNWTTIGIHIQEDEFGRTRPILQVEVEDKSSRSLWRPTTVTICSMLHEQKCLDLAVQFSPPLEPSERCFAIGRDHPVCASWESTLRLPVLQILEKRTDWQSLGVFLYGTSLENAKPTVVITVSGSKDHELLERTVSKTLKELHEDQLAVKVLLGKTSFA